MILLVTDQAWGPISKKQVTEWRPNIFLCGNCSDLEDVEVYHNVLGQHVHDPASKLVPLVPKEYLSADM